MPAEGLTTRPTAKRPGGPELSKFANSATSLIRQTYAKLDSRCDVPHPILISQRERSKIASPIHLMHPRTYPRVDVTAARAESALGVVTMSVHKLTAGSGYDYLTRQVAALDATEKGHTGLASYYTERGESPGAWIGSGLDGIDGLAAGDPVTA